MNYGLTSTRARLAGGAAILALSAGAALAQEGVEQVVVSSTRSPPAAISRVKAGSLAASVAPAARAVRLIGSPWGP